jgi:ADP-heptose:LPS heptosyltransferase
MTDLTRLRWPHHGLVAAIRWHLNEWLTRWPRLLNLLGARLTIFDAFGAPGDTLLTAIVCRHLKQRFPRIRLNCLTPNPELLLRDPHLDSINEPESYLCVWQWYPGLIERKDASENVLAATFRHLGFRAYEYRARVHLSEEELTRARQRLDPTVKPVLTFNTRSKEPVKNWPLASWSALLDRLRHDFDLVQLGDATEPEIAGVRRFAGQASLRESMALLACARLHVGPDSFLMHAANGLDVPAVILFGGSRTPANCGYLENLNLYVPMPCGPCWIHAKRGEVCAYDIECMKRISVEAVEQAARQLWTRISSRR